MFHGDVVIHWVDFPLKQAKCTPRRNCTSRGAFDVTYTSRVAGPGLCWKHTGLLFFLVKVFVEQVFIHQESLEVNPLRPLTDFNIARSVIQTVKQPLLWNPTLSSFFSREVGSGVPKRIVRAPSAKVRSHPS